MENMGLAQQAAGVPMGMPGQGMGRQGAVEPTVEEVVTLLMQGIAPEELLKQGVPMEILQQAVEMILAQEKQMANDTAPAQTQAGLAATVGM